MTDALTALGWDDQWQEAFDALDRDDVVPGRIVMEHPHHLRVATRDGELLTRLAGRMRHRAKSSADLPAVGDWVAVRPPRHESDTGQVEEMLPRRTRLARLLPGKTEREQVLAANMDTVFLVAGLDQEVNLRRLERFLTAARQSGAEPIFVLNKCDVCPTWPREVSRVEEAIPEVRVVAVSAIEEIGLDQLAPHIAPGRAAVMLGPSGVGKSTLTNHLAQEEVEETGEVREGDAKGRHTTTHRHLIRLKGGGLIIDTPGIREMQVGESAEGLEDTFEDIVALAAECRFTDCRHEGEPDCAVAAAVEEGTLSEARLSHYQRLRDEVEEAEESRVETERRRKQKGIELSKLQRQHLEFKKKHRGGGPR